MNENLLIKYDEHFSDKFGKNPYERTLTELLEKGYVNIDKFSGPSSHQTTDYLKKILNVNKAGHSGTLDPKVTGVLLIGLNKATRLMEYMLESNKEYVCLMYLHNEVKDEDLKKTFKNFTGLIKQTPPIVSAVKRQERDRMIYYLDLLETRENNKFILFRVGCQHGTYIRKLCSDMAEDLGVGGQMIELRRTKAGPIKEDDNIIGLDKLRNLWELYNEETDEKTKQIYENELKIYIRPMEEMVKDFKKVIVRDSAVDSLCHGSDLAIPGIAKLNENINIGDTIALMTHKSELIGMGTAFMKSDDVMKKKKGAFVKTEKIFMEEGIYPSYWTFNKEK